ncbi:MAG TPA: FG-GAP repeat protein [Planctomycetota bacterium]|nr:FG-GAP repeat protein [Planctomycetota bacterium]
MNPGQGWMVAFDELGFRVEPLHGRWTWGLSLTSWGFDGRELERAQASHVQREDKRVVYAWGAGLEEWFVDEAFGLEHGFTLRERPCATGGSGSDGPLHLTLAVRGGLRAHVEDGGRDVCFVDDSGNALVHYDGLTVFDADGVLLPARFEATRDGLRLSVDESEARYPLTIDPIAYQAYLKASNTDAADQFGSSVAADGDTLVVGAPGEDSDAGGVNGSEGSNAADGSGAVYVFVRSGGTWVQEAYLKASNTGAGDQFGATVGLSGDTLVVGAPGEDSSATGVDGDQIDDAAADAGAAYVFVRSGTAWTQEAYLKASNTGADDRFGGSVAVSGDTILVAARWEDSAATGVDGNGADDSAANSGAAYVFERGGGVWAQQAYLKASNTAAGDEFGFQVALSADTAVVGAPEEDSSATGVDGNGSDDGATASGAAYVFARSGIAWSQAAYLKALNTGASDWFGRSVAVWDGTVVVGAMREGSSATGVNGNPFDDSAPLAGAAYVYVDGGSGWLPQAYLKASNTDSTDLFGWAVAVRGERALVGAVFEGSDSIGVGGDQSRTDPAFTAGAAYVFARNGVFWSQEAYVKASNTGHQDLFGASLALAEGVLAVGASAEDSSAVGVGGDQTDELAPDAGAVYVYDLQATFNPYCTQTLPTSVDSCFALLTVSDPTLATGSWNTTNIPRSSTIPDGTTLGVYIFTNGVGFGQSTVSMPVTFGTLCLQNFKRSSAYCTPVSLSTTSGLCNTGVLTLDTNCNGGALGLSVGEDVNVQLWFRDPTTQNFGQSRASNAIYYTLQ